VATLLLKLVDENKVSLDDKLSKWLPEVPHADRVTLGQLAQMTSGYVDYVIGKHSHERSALRKTRSGAGTVHDILSFATSQPLLYETRHQLETTPHTNYVLLGLALEKATGQENVEAVVGQGASASRADEHSQPRLPPEIPSPVLHAFSSERRAFLKIPSGTPFLRGIHVLGPVVDHHPRRHPDHQHL